jgi:hypothetical protein
VLATLTVLVLGQWSYGDWGGGRQSPAPKTESAVVVLENTRKKCASDCECKFCPCQATECLMKTQTQNTARDMKSSATARESAVARVAPTKGWYRLTNEPGTIGYGALNERGEVVVEIRRAVVTPVSIGGPAPRLTACGPNGCPAPQRRGPLRRRS